MADNTGFLTGVDTSMGLHRLGFDGSQVANFFDFNEANGSFVRSPSSNWDAVDEAKLRALIKSNSRCFYDQLRLL